MFKTSEGKMYECTDVECPQGHTVTLVFIEKKQAFAFACKECNACSDVAAAYDSTGRVRKCIIRERPQ